MRNHHGAFALLALLLGCPKLQAQTNWNETLKAVASDRDSRDRFGHSVAIDGNYAIVGADLEDVDASGQNFNNNAGAA